MAFHTLASSSAASTTPSLIFPVTEKLNRGNHPMWKLQVETTLKGTELASFLNEKTLPLEPFLAPAKGADSKEPPVANPEYGKWIARDQQVLSFLLTSLSKEILGQIPTTIKTAREAWGVIEGMYASQSCARIISTRIVLATAAKGMSSISDYFAKMKGLADDMASPGRKLEDDELVSYILTGLDDDFDAVVSAVAATVEPISVSELYTQLISFESRKEMKNGGSNSSANAATRGGRGGGNQSRGRNGGGRGGGGRGGFGRGGGGRSGGRGPNF